MNAAVCQADENLSNSGVIVGCSYTQHMGANWFELDMELF
jgi:hypothetical protein